MLSKLKSNKRVLFFEWEDYEQRISEKNDLNFPENYQFTDERFSVDKASGYDVISIKEHSSLSNSDLKEIADSGIIEIAIRIAGFNMLDVDYAEELGLKVYRVASYSPESIAEFALSLILALARKHNVQRRYQQQRLNERNLDSMGILLSGKTLGLHGLGRIGSHLAVIANNGLGMNVQFYDPYIDYSPVAKKVEDLSELYKTSNIVSIHLPLTDGTKGVVNSKILQGLPDNFMLINTARGEIMDSESVIDAIESGEISHLGIDVWDKYDEYRDEFSGLDNVIQTYHVAFFTETAVRNMVVQTLESIAGEAREENILAD